MSVHCTVRKIRPGDTKWLTQVMTVAWGSVEIVASKLFNTLELPGFIAEIQGKPAGVVTYNISNKACEIVSLNCMITGQGLGTKLIDTLKAGRAKEDWKKIWLVTSNDNIDALRFYQKRGFRIVKVYPNAIEDARKIKPDIPLIGNFGIPLKDALELEYQRT